jgi:predicted DNA-binding protein (UPF0251 family)
MANPKHPGGRPTERTPEVVAKLEEAFKNDFKDEEACSHAGIHRATYYRWLNEDEKFRDKMEEAQQFLFKVARNKLAKGLQDGTISPTEYLDRRDRKRYSKQVTMDGEQKVVFMDAAKAKAMNPQELFDALRSAGIGSKE